MLTLLVQNLLGFLWFRWWLYSGDWKGTQHLKDRSLCSLNLDPLIWPTPRLFFTIVSFFFLNQDFIGGFQKPDPATLLSLVACLFCSQFLILVAFFWGLEIPDYFQNCWKTIRCLIPLENVVTPGDVPPDSAEAGHGQRPPTTLLFTSGLGLRQPWLSGYLFFKENLVWRVL